jgi:hypothetical protein
MAFLKPSLRTVVPVVAGDYAELECLAYLESTLPADYLVLHHLGWHTTASGKDHFGELDVVVLSPAGNVICLEIKAGNVEFAADGVFKTYGAGRKDVIGQVRHQHAALISGFKQAGMRARISHFLVLPHFQVPQGGSLAYPRERIIDATQYAVLAKTLVALDFGEPNLPKEALRRIEDLLCGRFGLRIDVDAMDSAEAEIVRKISDGLAVWTERIESPAQTYVIEATAGSGKTQLALALLQEAAERKERALYVCFNRLLADHMGQLAPAQMRVETFHQLCRDIVEHKDGEIDFSAKGAMEKVVARFAELAPEYAGRYSLIIIDEAQDFDFQWIEVLFALGAESHRLYLLQDEDQRIYSRQGFAVDGATLIRSNDNFRSPRKIVDLINLLHLTTRPVCARSPFDGDVPEVMTYAADGDPRAMLAATSDAVASFLAEGYRAEQIVVLSLVGKERSEAIAANEIGGVSVRRFLDAYDKVGNTEWSQGDLLVDTIFRFKGRSAPAVVLTEIDFAELGERERHRLFVGMSRARQALKLVVSDACAQVLAAEIAQ